MKLFTSIMFLLTLSGCSLTGFSMEHKETEDGRPYTVLNLPRDRVFMGTGYDCMTYDKRAIFGYKLFDFDTKWGMFATGPMAADNYAGVYLARKTSFWEYWLTIYGGRDFDDDRGTIGLGYMKTF